MDGTIGRNLKAHIGEPKNTQAPPQFGPWMPTNIAIMQPGYEVSAATIGGETDIQVVEYQAPTPQNMPVRPHFGD